MTKFEAWIEAMRLRTLPLSVSGIIVGSGMAALLEKWNPLILFCTRWDKVSTCPGSGSRFFHFRLERLLYLLVW